MGAPLDEHQKNQLLDWFGADRFSTGASACELHIHDISPHRVDPPSGVVWPRTTEEISRLLSWTYAQGLAVTPWGAGTSTEGNPLPVRGGLVVDMTAMNKVLAIRPEDLQADVEPGLFRRELNRQLSSSGLFFPVDPGADATIGGMIANNASGVKTVKYGATKDYVMRLTVVLPDGEIITAGNRAHKSSSGYDVGKLFIGSEGTLGIVTEATLRLCGVPEHQLAATAAFADLESASEAVAAIIGTGLEPAALELLTEGLIELMNKENGLALEVTPSLFCEFHGISRASLEEVAALAREICEDCGSLSFHYGIDEQERRTLWQARHDAWETINRAHPGKNTLIVDAAVPISRYPEVAVFASRAVRDQGVHGYVFGHAGDGNIHVVMAGDPEDQREWQRLETVNQLVVEKSLALGGTCTGEHGVGIGKRKFMALEHGASLHLMKQIKDLIDPKGLMNPGKIFI